MFSLVFFFLCCYIVVSTVIPFLFGFNINRYCHFCALGSILIHYILLSFLLFLLLLFLVQLHLGIMSVLFLLFTVVIGFCVCYSLFTCFFECFLSYCFFLYFFLFIFFFFYLLGCCHFCCSLFFFTANLSVLGLIVVSSIVLSCYVVLTLLLLDLVLSVFVKSCSVVLLPV